VLCLGRLPCETPVGASCTKTMEGSTGQGNLCEDISHDSRARPLDDEKKFVRSCEWGSGGRIGWWLHICGHILRRYWGGVAMV
jgi:hypothetical protein